MNLSHIAVDAMGGDAGPAVTVPACLQQLNAHPDLQLSLYGDISALQASLQQLQVDNKERLHLHSGTALAAADNNAFGVIRRGTDSALFKAIDSHAQRQTAACVSAGNTAALLACGKKLLGMLPASHRPAICKLFPHPQRPSYLLDLGATVDASAEQLVEFAVLADCLARTLRDYPLPGPAIALLSNGVEAGKGNAAVKLAAERLAQNSGLNFQGYIEADQLFAGVVDIVVCDGFNGNIALKSAEGAVQRLFDFMDAAQESALQRSELQRLRGQWAPNQLNGALLLGLDGLLVKSHGGADVAAFASAINEAYGLLQGKVGDNLRQALLKSA